MNRVCTLCPKGETVGRDQIEEARELRITDRAVQLDSLSERQRDPRVKRVIQNIITGESRPEILRGDDFRHALGLVLVAIESGTPSIANPIYREVVARVLSEESQLMIPAPEFRWTTAGDRLDLDAFLQRIFNGGRIEREYAAGRGRIDLAIWFGGPDPSSRSSSSSTAAARRRSRKALPRSRATVTTSIPWRPPSLSSSTGSPKAG